MFLSCFIPPPTLCPSCWLLCSGSLTLGPSCLRTFAHAAPAACSTLPQSFTWQMLSFHSGLYLNVTFSVGPSLTILF